MRHGSLQKPALLSKLERARPTKGAQQNIALHRVLKKMKNTATPSVQKDSLSKSRWIAVPLESPKSGKRLEV